VRYIVPIGSYSDAFILSRRQKEYISSDAAMWPTVFALKELTAVEEARIRTLVKKAVG
jgi:hypothetical protein